MSDNEKDIIRKLINTIPSLDDQKKQYIIAFAEGMAAARTIEKNGGDKSE